MPKVKRQGVAGLGFRQVPPGSKARLLTTLHKNRKSLQKIIQQIKSKCKGIVLNSSFSVNLSMAFGLLPSG